MGQTFSDLVMEDRPIVRSGPDEDIDVLDLSVTPDGRPLVIVRVPQRLRPLVIVDGHVAYELPLYNTRDGLVSLVGVQPDGCPIVHVMEPTFLWRSGMSCDERLLAGDKEIVRARHVVPLLVTRSGSVYYRVGCDAAVHRDGSVQKTIVTNGRAYVRLYEGADGALFGLWNNARGILSAGSVYEEGDGIAIGEQRIMERAPVICDLSVGDNGISVLINHPTDRACRLATLDGPSGSWMARGQDIGDEMYEMTYRPSFTILPDGRRCYLGRLDAVDEIRWVIESVSQPRVAHASPLVVTSGAVSYFATKRASHVRLLHQLRVTDPVRREHSR